MNKQNLKFGFSEIDITPQKKAPLAGQFAERISEYVEKPITATAMAIEAGDDQAIFVCADIIGISYNLLSAVREKIKDNDLGIDPQKIICSAIHTHTAPIYTQMGRLGSAGNRSFRGMLEAYMPKDRKYIESASVSNNPDIITPDEALELFVEKIAKVVVEAWKNRKSASYVNAFGRAVVGLCRRAAYSDGSAQMWGNTNTAVFDSLEGGSDSGIELMYVFDDNKKLMGIVANLACPAQCVQHRHFISPDFWGEVKMLLRKRFGDDIFLVTLCSPAGDQCPVDLIRWVEPESDINDPNCKRINPPKRKADPSMFDLAGMRKTGKRIANEIIDVYEDGLDELIDTAEFEHQVHEMQLPIRRVTLEDIAKAEREIRDYFIANPGDVNYNDAAKLQIHVGTLRRAELQDVQDILDTEVHIIRLGNIAIATNPFELFLDYGNQIKARSLAEQTFLIQLANGAEGYLPTKKAENGGHYSAFVSSGNVGHIGGEQLVRQTLKQINGMFKD